MIVNVTYLVTISSYRYTTRKEDSCVVIFNARSR